MKIALWIVFGLLVVSIPVGMFLFQRWRQKRADRDGVVVYATVIAMEPVKAFGKPSAMMKIEMSIQEPDKPRRVVVLRSQIAPGQKIVPGMLLSVVVDPKNPKRVYPASEDAMKRVVLTGPRRDRRMMKSGRGVQRGDGRNGRRGQA